MVAVMEERQRRLERWVEQQACERQIDLPDPRLEPVSGDASFRRYFRLYGHQGGRAGSWIAVDAPPDKEDSEPFVRIARQWHAAGIRVPALIATDLSLGFMLLEDFGDRLLLPELDPGRADQLYQLALHSLRKIQAVPSATLPPYDETLLQREMKLFDEWFLGRLLGLELDVGERARLEQVRALLVDNALSQPQVSVHRDYHARNLMLLEDGALGIIDFQDAVRGPVTYDLVSLLRDAYVRWPDAAVNRWVEGFRRDCLDSGLPVAAPAPFLRQFELMGAQRQLKVLGIFSRLWLRDGKAGYLADMPRTLGYLLRTAARYPALAELEQMLRQRVVPAMAAHERFDADALYLELEPA